MIINQKLILHIYIKICTIKKITNNKNETKIPTQVLALDCFGL